MFTPNLQQDLEDARRELAKLNDEVRVLRDAKIEYLLTQQQEQMIRKMRDGGASQKDIDDYIDLRRIIRQSDSANSRAQVNGERAFVLEQALAKAQAAPTSVPAAASAGTIWAKVYTEDGYQISLTLPASSVNDALKHMSDIRAAGLLPAPVEPPSTEETETITTVVRREFVDAKGSAIPVIDCYPDWRGQYGQFSFTRIYLDTAADVAQFEAHAGVKLDALPVYDGQSPIMRKEARPHRCEVKVKAFVVCKKYSGDKEVDGKMQRVFKFSHYVSADGYAAATPKPASAAPTDQPIVPTSMIPANVQAALTSAIHANPFDAPAVKEALGAAIKNAGLTGTGLPFLFANIIPGKTLTRVSDAHPDITPDEFMKRLPKIGEAYRAHLEAQTQPDPDDDPTPTHKPAQRDGQSAAAKSSSTPAAGDSFNSPRASTRVDTPLNGRTGSSTRRTNPLVGEMVELDRIEIAKDKWGMTDSQKWIGHGVITTPSGAPHRFEINIWQEDARKLREAGYLIEWPNAENQYKPYLANPAPVVILEMRKSGLAIQYVEPAVHPARREKPA